MIIVKAALKANQTALGRAVTTRTMSEKLLNSGINWTLPVGKYLKLDMEYSEL